MSEKYLLFSLDDEDSRKLGEVISNPTCKKIVNLLAEKDLSESDIAEKLSLPLNTVDYNIKNLVKAGIVERSKNFFWSTRGKKIEIYKLANKLIVISPKKMNIYSKLKGVVPTAVICAAFTSVVYWYYRNQPVVNTVMKPLAESAEKTAMSAGGVGAPAAADMAASTSQVIITNAAVFWPWFLAGSLIAIISFIIWNWKKL